MSSSLPFRSVLALVLAAAIWGLAFVAQRVGMEHMGPWWFNGIRFALGFFSLLPVALLFRAAATRRGEANSPWKAAVVPGLGAGVVLFIAAGLQQVGLQTTTAGKAAFITGFYIVLVPILGLALGQKTRRSTGLGALLAITGLYFLSVNEDLTMAVGDLFVLVSALFWTVHIMVIDRFSRRVDVLVLSLVQFAVCSVLSLIWAAFTEPVSLKAIQASMGPIVYAGVLSVGVAYTLQVVGQKRLPASYAAIILSLETVFAALGGWFFLSEELGLRGLLGAGLMFAGMLVPQLASLASRRSPDAPSETPRG